MRAARSTLSAGCAGWLAALAAAPAGSPTSLQQDLYVWQRTWDEPLKQAIQQAAPRVDGFVALSAEVAWVDGRPNVVRVPLDFAALTATGRPTGIALRVGPYPGDIDEQAAGLADLACALTSAARAGGLEPTEFQIDFDCPESRLPALARALGAIHKRLGALPLVATALPCWLDKPGWREVTQACDSFVLQVHSVSAPAPGQRMTLCNPAEAKRWVESADAAGRPFRVALPTYGYVAGFDESGHLVQLQADGSASPLTRAHSKRLVLADAAAMSSLVAAWDTQRPPNLLGVSWYRLPLASDRLVWTLATLELAMRGAALRRQVDVHAILEKDGTVNIELRNVGDVDVLAADASQIVVDWIADEPLGIDGLNGFSARRLTGPNLAFDPPADAHLMVLKARETRAIGWIRFASGRVGSVSATMGDGSR